MLQVVEELAPSLLPFVHSTYSSPSLLFSDHRVMKSSEGVQQGDPLGPLLFCLTSHHLTTLLISPFRVFGLDDGTLSGRCDEVLKDLNLIERDAAQLGLQLNVAKSEVICKHPSTLGKFFTVCLVFHATPLDHVTRLGSPLVPLLMAISLRT